MLLTVAVLLEEEGARIDAGLDGAFWKSQGEWYIENRRVSDIYSPDYGDSS